jgi:hypothetical protein
VIGVGLAQKQLCGEPLCLAERSMISITEGSNQREWIQERLMRGSCFCKLSKAIERGVLAAREDDGKHRYLPGDIDDSASLFPLYHQTGLSR